MISIHDAISGFSAAELALGKASTSFAPDDVPFADWNLFSIGRKRRLPLYHTRGCTYGCTYCPYLYATGRVLIRRSIARTMEEWCFQCQRLRPRRVVLRDPTFGISEEDSLELLRAIRDLDSTVRVPFEVETRGDLITPDLAQALALAGCVEVKLGVEALNPSWLKSVHRIAPDEGEIYADRVRGSHKLLSRYGIGIRQYTLAVSDDQNADGALPSASLGTVRQNLKDSAPLSLMRQSLREYPLSHSKSQMRWLEDVAADSKDGAP
jgi:hypothetical protein